MHIRNYYILWLLIGLIYCCNLTLDVMEVDAAQYASMAAEMKDNGNYLQVFHRGEDYLDKPPLLFWLSAISYTIFGVNNVSYKLPALLALLLGLWSTYRFVLLYDKRETALMATTILASTQAFFLMTNDVRTDGLLTGFVMFAVYQCAAYLKHGRGSHLVLAGVGVGLAMLAKGPLGAIIPASALFADRLMKGAWKDLFKLKWLAVVVVALLLLIPMCYGLYTQFDLHPDKSVYGLDGPSGLRFFFWTQSFGRITGEIYWDNNSPWYYFMMTFLWDFMPWVIIFYAGLVFALRSMFKGRKKHSEYFTIGGLIVNLILLSLSHYKLPHYIFPLLPFAAVITARWLGSMQQESHAENGPRPAANIIAWMQFILMHAFYAIIAFGFLKAFPPGSIFLPVVICFGFFLMWIVFFKYRQPSRRILLTGSITAIAFNIFLSMHFYPQLMQYQSGAQAGRVIHQDRVQHERKYYTYKTSSYTLDFYSRKYVPTIDPGEQITIPPGSWIFASGEDFDEIMKGNPDQFKIIRAFDEYRISMLKLKFVLKETRQGQLKKSYLLEKL